MLEFATLRASLRFSTTPHNIAPTTTAGSAFGSAPSFLEALMKVKTTRPVAISGEHYDAGKSVDVDDKVGRELIAMQKAIPVAEKKKAAKSREDAPAENLTTR